MTILMDGKVQEIISAKDLRQVNSLSQLIAPKQHLRLAINELITQEKTQEKKEDYKFYKEVIKNELKEANPQLYQTTFSPKTLLKNHVYGVSVRVNMAGKSQL